MAWIMSLSKSKMTIFSWLKVDNSILLPPTNKAYSMCNSQPELAESAKSYSQVVHKTNNNFNRYHKDPKPSIPKQKQNQTVCILNLNPEQV